MRFYTPQPSLRKVVCCWQAEVLNPKEVWPAVLGYSFQQGSLSGGTIVIWIGSIFTPSIFKILIYLAMEIFNIGVAERFLSSGYGVVAILNSCADMLLKIRRPLMAGIIRILLEITLEMLVALNVFKTVLFVIVYGIVMGMGCVVSYGLISVEPEACPFHENEDYRVIPVDDLV